MYGPNWDDDGFFRKLFSTIPDLESHYLILGRDFNCCLNPTLDRSSTKLARGSKSSNVIKSFMEEYGASDPWRFLNPQSKRFSFFSPVYPTFSRINFFLLDNKLYSQVRAVSYNAIVVSDHAPVTLELSFPDKPNSRCPWRLNPLLLSNCTFVVEYVQ